MCTYCRHARHSRGVFFPSFDLEPTARRIGCIALAEALRNMSLRVENPAALSELEKTLEGTVRRLEERREKMSPLSQFADPS